YFLEELIVDVIRVADTTASGGDIHVSGQNLSGTGSLLAPRDTEIAITNRTSAFLRLNALTIEDHGGRILFNGSTVSSVDRVNELNESAVAQFQAFSAEGGSAEMPSIVVVQEYNDPDSILPPPDLFVSGDIVNLTGDVRLTNMSGSIKIQSEGANAAPSILANGVYLQAERDVLQSYVDGFVHVGGDP